MFDESCFSLEVTDFRKLGTGHKRRKVVVVDQNRRILFVARVLQNRPCIGELRFDNGRSFNLRSRTLGNQKVSLFHWSEELECRWFWQLETDKIERWLEGGDPEDVIVLADFVAEESGLPKTKHVAMFAVFAKQEIRNV